ncbi:MAG: Rrf2 family transcriptional regulator [Clostridiales bacterium]|nr:Rrf2 family transcriptional regulator [Clostridiales bacterium]
MITRETDYALRLLRSLMDEELHPAAEIAEKEMVPQAFSYKILKKLSKAGYIQILRGADGGCRLAADLKKISLYDLMNAMGDNCGINRCMDDSYQCPWREKHEICEVHCRLAKIQETITTELQAHSLQELLHSD